MEGEKFGKLTEAKHWQFAKDRGSYAVETWNTEEGFWELFCSNSIYLSKLLVLLFGKTQIPAECFQKACQILIEHLETIIV